MTPEQIEKEFKKLRKLICCNATGSSYTVYTALLSQSGTDAPTAVVLENTLSGPIVWTVDGAPGAYLGTLAGAFPANKTFLITSGNFTDQDTPVVTLARVDDNGVGLNVLTSAFAGTHDWINIPVEIRVYP